VTGGLHLGCVISGSRLLRQFRKRGGNGAEGDFVPGVFAEIK
jgi:hypothetical protein